MNAPLRVVSTAWFGRRPPANTSVLAAWGARALLEGRGRDQSISTLPDRQQAWTPELGEKAGNIDLPPAFLAFVRGKVFPWLRNRCGERWINPGGGEVFSLLDGHMVAQACAQHSYGYLYVGAWMLERPETGSS